MKVKDISLDSLCLFLKHKNYTHYVEVMYYKYICEFLDYLNQTGQDLTVDSTNQYLDKFCMQNFAFPTKMRKFCLAIGVLYRFCNRGDDIRKLRRNLFYRKKQKISVALPTKQQFIDFFEADDVWLEYKFLLATGLRISEMCSLTKDNFIGDNKIIVCASKTPRKREVVEVTGKFYESFREYVPVKWCKTYLQRKIKPCLYKYFRVEKGTAHVLRRLHVGLLQTMAVPLSSCAYQLGHCSYKITMGYYMTEPTIIDTNNFKFSY